MSETFEEEIKKLFRKHYFSKALEVTLKELEKDVVAVYRLHCKKLADFVNKNRPERVDTFGEDCAIYRDTVEEFLEELEGLVPQKKGDTTK